MAHFGKTVGRSYPLALPISKRAVHLRIKSAFISNLKNNITTFIIYQLCVVECCSEFGFSRPDWIRTLILTFWERRQRPSWRWGDLTSSLPLQNTAARARRPPYRSHPTFRHSAANWTPESTSSGQVSSSGTCGSSCSQIIDRESLVGLL